MTHRLAWLALLALSACSVVHYIPGEWPPAIPSEEYYTGLWEQDEENQKLQDKKTYLTWCLRFYKGWPPIAPTGWHDTEKILLKDTPPEIYTRLHAKLFYLGYIMSGEWAKDNRTRGVDVRMLQIWSRVVVRSRKFGRMEETIHRIEADVFALLARELESKEISRKRYSDLLKKRTPPPQPKAVAW